MRTIEQIVAAEIHYCVSALVSTLANGYGNATVLTGDIVEASEQAFDLASSIPDYEAAAIEAGWTGEPGAFKRADLEAVYVAESWKELCDLEGVEPHEREVYEHWLVSDWLADRLAEQGEKVDKDFCGLTVWARTTSGQGIASDSVIERIHAALMAA